MPQAYKQQITKTFRDDAIRSVLLIDDEYHPYTDLAQKQQELIQELQKIAPKLPEGELPPAIPQDAEAAKQALMEAYASVELLRESANLIADSFKRTSVAAEFGRFFHEAECICDVEKQTAQLNPEKVRKSDLIILDYCLTGNDATKSLQLLRDLSASKHMNLVVIYTNQPLETVWLQIAATLRGPKIAAPADYFTTDQESLDKWGDAEDVYKESWAELSREQKINFILSKSNVVTNDARIQLWQDIQEQDDFDEDIHKQPTEAIINYLCEFDVNVHNLLATGGAHSEIHGQDRLWIQSGEVFIALCEKKDSSQEEIAQQPQAVWDKLEEALHSWYPNFYRVVLSELQNRIEDSNFSMSKKLGKPEHEQIALLWAILKESPDKQLNVSENLLRHILRDISDELIKRDDNAVSKFIKNTALYSLREPLEYVPFKKQCEKHKGYLRKTVQLAKENCVFHDEAFDSDFCLKIAHALNERTTTLQFLPDYITTGMVLKSTKKRNTRWFMCVTPSCDTVPEQKDADNAAQLAPHRLLTFVKLKQVELSEALATAYQSSFIFISDGALRIALSVIDSITKQPDLVKFVIVNHNNRCLGSGGQKALKLKNNGDGIKTEELTLLPVVLLDSSYAARYQAVQSHHEGRIGVDFTSADFTVAHNEPAVHV